MVCGAGYWGKHRVTMTGQRLESKPGKLRVLQSQALDMGCSRIAAAPLIFVLQQALGFLCPLGLSVTAVSDVIRPS